MFTEFQSKKSSIKSSDFGIVNIVQEATPIAPEPIPIESQQDPTATEQLAEQTFNTLEDIRKFNVLIIVFVCFSSTVISFLQHLRHV